MRLPATVCQQFFGNGLENRDLIHIIFITSPLSWVLFFFGLWPLLVDEGVTRAEGGARSLTPFIALSFIDFTIKSAVLVRERSLRLPAR